MRKNAFTLIELLVVVTIIVVLIAILIPSLDGAINEAQRARCLANLKGVGLALRFYANDYSGYIPQWQEIGTSAPNGRTIQDHTWFWYPEWLESYSAHRDIYKCPNDSGWPASGAIPNPLNSYPQYDHVSYYLNIAPAHWTTISPTINGLKVFTLPQSQKTVLLGDWSGIVGFSWHKPVRGAGKQYPDAKNNWVFLDGHAATVATYWDTAKPNEWSWNYAVPSNYEYLWLPEL